MKLHYLLALITSLISCTTYTAQQNDASKKLKRDEQSEHTKNAAASFAGLEQAPAGMVVSTHPAPQSQPMDYVLAKKQENEKLGALKVAATNSTKRKSTNESALLCFLPEVLCSIVNDYCFNYSAEFCPAVHRNVILKQIGKTSLKIIRVSCNGTLISSSDQRTIKLWNSKTGKCIYETEKLKDGSYITSIAFNYNTLAILNSNGVLTIWEIPTNENKKTKASCIGTVSKDPTNPEDEFTCVAITADGETIVTGSENGTVKKYSRSGTLLAKLEDDSIEIQSVAISADGNTIGFTNSKETRLFDASGQSILLPHIPADSKIDVSPDGNTIITAGFSTNVKIWNRADNRLIQIKVGILYSNGDLTADSNTAFISAINRPLVVWDIIAQNFAFRRPTGTSSCRGGSFMSRFSDPAISCDKNSASIFTFDSQVRKQLASMKFEELVALKELLTQLSIAQGFNPQTALGPDNTLIDSPHRDIVLTPEIGAALFALPLNLQQNICAFFDITETHEQFLKRTTQT